MNLPNTVPHDYMRTRKDYYPLDTTGVSSFWDHCGWNSGSGLHGRLDAPDEIPAGSMRNEINYDWAYDRWIICPSSIKRDDLY